MGDTLFILLYVNIEIPKLHQYFQVKCDLYNIHEDKQLLTFKYISLPTVVLKKYFIPEIMKCMFTYDFETDSRTIII